MGRVAKIALVASAFTGISATGTLFAASATTMASEHSIESREERDRSRSQTDHRFRIDPTRQLLDAHNRERVRLNLPKLKWNRHLQREAEEWGRELSRRGRLEHASKRLRNGTGENLWMGEAGIWDVDTMVNLFIDEKKHYRHGNFPDISRTGRWSDVAHYTQVIWRDTQEVGCAVVTERGWDVLVCRYWPAGNVWGRRAY